jgi:trans-2,3-dihydro-3-hydroxyanthranilate isomerase
MLLHSRPIVRRPTLDDVTRRFRFRQVDVFTDVALSGNPLAVFTDADGLTDGEMQALAREMNLSETAFVLPPTTAGSAAGASHRLRIFTPGRELPFAGHPAIGAAWILADEGLIALEGPRHLVRQEMAAGVTRLAVGVAAADGVARPTEVTMFHREVELLERLDGDELDELCDAIEVPPSQIGWRSGGRKRKARPQVISTGLPHLIVPVADREVLMDIDTERRAYVAELCRSMGCDSAALVAPGGSGAIVDADVTVRLFDAGELRIDADPATGAAAGPIAVFLGQLVPTRDATFTVVIEQGTEVGRPSRLTAAADFDPDGAPVEVRVTGSVVPVIEGWVTLP